MRLPPIAGRRALVLGASGFLGRWVLHALAERGALVVAQVRDPRRLDERFRRSAREVIACDLARERSGTELVRDVGPDVVFNLAGYGVAKEETNPSLLARLDVELVGELAAALAAVPSAWTGQRLIHPGSALEAGPRPADLDEDAAGRPDTPYGRSKLAATELLAAERARGLACLAVRPFTVFGLGERTGRLVPTLLAAREREGPIPLSSGTQARDWIYVEDVARVLCELASLDAARTLAGRYPFDAKTLNLASGVLTPVREFVLAFAEEFAIPRERLAFGALPGLSQEMFHPPVPVARLAEALGWTPPRAPAEGLARMQARLSEGFAA